MSKIIYYYGTEGSFDTNFTNGFIKDVKILLNDGTRIVGFFQK